VSQLVAGVRGVVVSISAGFTSAEMVELVYEYHLQPHGRKACWLVDHGLTYHRLRRWRESLYEGDLDRGLIPREGSYVTTPPVKRTAIARARAAEAARHEAEIARLKARVDELEQTNEALGKAIGLLHARSEQEPDASPTTIDLGSSSTSKTDSSSS
jgi:transposase-like protein